jgi:HSP20 family protein
MIIKNYPLSLFSRPQTTRGYDSFFSDLFGELAGSQTGLTYNEKEGVYQIDINVAGYRKEDISVEAADSQITVTAENQKRGKASKTFYVPEIDTGRIEAKLEDGILTVTAFQPETALPKRIEIK